MNGASACRPRTHIAFRGHVRGVEGSALRGQGALQRLQGGLRRRQVQEQHARTRARKTQRSGATKATGRASDKGYPAR